MYCMSCIWITIKANISNADLQGKIAFFNLSFEQSLLYCIMFCKSEPASFLI